MKKFIRLNFLLLKPMRWKKDSKKTGAIFLVLAITISTTLFSGCTDETRYTADLDLIIPETEDYGIPIQQLEYIYETDYTETEETSPIYDMTIPEYIFIRYNGTGVKKSITFFAFKLDSTSKSEEIFDLYKETYLLHATELENEETFGDETFTTQLSVSGLSGHGLEFRYANIVIVMAGFSVELDTFHRVGRIIENNIESHLN